MNKSNESFLSYIAKIAIDNPNVNLKPNIIYRFLVRFNAKNPTSDKSISIFFPQWIKYFENKTNIVVKNDENWKYFCQFYSSHQILSDEVGCIKLYIPIDKEHINESARLIFQYLEEQNISHLSKIGSDIRTDNIVIRVSKKTDAEKIRQFILKNKNIRSGLMNVTPFTYTDGLIGYAFDGVLSYNDIASRLLAEYINYMKKNDMLHCVTIDNFQKYIDKLYYNTFVTKIQLKSLAKSAIFKECATSKNNSRDFMSFLIDLKSIMELLSKNLATKFDLNEYYKWYDKVHDKGNIKQLKAEFMKCLSGVTLDVNTVPVEIQKEMLYKAIKITYSKYGKEHTIYAINLMINNQSFAGITKENNARSDLNKCVDVMMINDLIVSIIGKCDALKLLDCCINNKNESIVLSQNSNYMEVLNEASILTYSKYGLVQLNKALKNAITNNFEYFTNDNYVRERLYTFKSNINVLDEIRRFLLVQGFTMDEISGKEVALYINEIESMVLKRAIRR